MTQTAKTMSFSTAPTKSLMVAEAIAENIRNGVLKPGDRIQTVRGLSNQFSVSISVVQAALRDLESQRLIERKANSVALVRDPNLANGDAQNQVMLCLENTGHVFSEVSGMIGNRLISRGFLPMTMDFKQMMSVDPDANFKRNINDILASGLKSVILSGLYYWHYPFMEKHPDVRAVFLYMIDYAGSTPERAVLLDLEEANYQAAAHLAALGRKRIMLCTFKTEPRAVSLDTIGRHHSTQIRNGYERALREHDIATYNRTLYRNGEVDEKELRKVISGKDAPDAIVCTEDRVAMQVEMLALKYGLKVPDDLAITGAFDTPWSELSPVPLTTITYDWNRLADLAIELATVDEPEQKIHYLKPRLLARESTVGNNNSQTQKTINVKKRRLHHV